MSTEDTQFKKNSIPWNKGKIGVQVSTRKGKKLEPLSEETKEKIRLSRLGIPSGMKGKKHSDETRLRMSLAQKKGSEHHRWIEDRSILKKDNRRDDPAYFCWSRDVKRRDEWKCKINNKDCNGKVVSHHILGWASYPELRYDINNGITLCHAHHPTTRVEETKLVPVFEELMLTSIIK